MTPADRFAAALRRAMADARLGVGEMAEAVGVSRQAVSAWRSGRSVPDIERIGHIERALDLPLGELLHTLVEASDVGHTVASGVTADGTPAGYDSRIAKLPEHVRRTIDDIIDTYEADRS